MFGALRLGATLILHEGWPTPPSVAATVELNQPSIVLSVPTLFQRLCEFGSPSKLAFRAVRCYVSAGERLPPQVGVESGKASGRPIIDAMSCSELVHKIFANTLSARRAGSSGRPVPGVEVRLIDTDGSEIAQSGRSGQLEVRAPFLCAGYRLDDTQPRAAAHRPTARFRGEWFATGDEYLRDEDGFYHHCGRSDDMLKVSGLWVSPSEIEDMLAGIPTVREAAAVFERGCGRVIGNRALHRRDIKRGGRGRDCGGARPAHAQSTGIQASAPIRARCSAAAHPHRQNSAVQAARYGSCGLS